MWTCFINQQTKKRTVGWGHKLFVWRVFCGGRAFVSLINSRLPVNNVILARCKIGKQATVASRCYLPTVPLFPPFVCLSLCGVCTTHPPRKQAPLSGQQNTWVLQFTVRLLLRLGKREKKKNGWGWAGCLRELSCWDMKGRQVCLCVCLTEFCKCNTDHTVNRLL